MKQKFYMLSFILIVASCNQSMPKTGMEGKKLPAFVLQLADSTSHFNTANIPSGEPIVFLLFNPYCPYCRAETADILSHINNLQKIRFYIITGAKYKDMKVFYNYLNLEKYPGVTVGVDSSSSFVKYFQASGVPYMAIYNNEKRLKQVLIGESPISTIQKVVSE